MVSEKRIKELIVEALEKVKEFDASYKKMNIHDQTLLMGEKSELESIAFTVFITQLEEKIEAEAGVNYTLEISEITNSPDVSLEAMAKGIFKSLASAAKK